MPKLIKTVFVILSILLVCALIIACASVITMDNASSDKDSVPPAESSTISEDSSEESSALISEETTEDMASEETTEDVTGEETTEEPSEEPSQDDSSVAPPPATDGGTDPITPPPSGVVGDEGDVFFNDSLFVGHSVMVHFKNYVTSWRKTYSDILGNAIFGCSSSFSFYNNINESPEDADNTLPKFAGQSYKIEDLVAVTGAKTVYLGLMGLNDLGMVGKPDTCASFAADEVYQCIDAIKEKNPDVTIVVLSATYLVRDISYPRLNNRNMSLLNSYVLDYCNKNGIDFVDVATPLTDGGGYLAGVYCSDNYCHLKQNAYYVWLDVLRDYAQQKSEGTWQNPDSIPLFNN